MSIRTVKLLLRSNVTPSAFLGYLRGRAAGVLQRFFPDAESAREVESAQRTFERNTRNGLYSNTWFDGSIGLWVKLLAPMKVLERPQRLLEIGSWEGRSTVFLLGYLPGGTVTAIDTWEGGVEHQRQPEVATLEGRFDHNIAAFRDRLVKRKGLSSVVLADLAREETECFDFIFIDGSHFADDVMIDAVLAWRLLQNGGIMVFDDYLWRLERYGWKKNPAQAVNLFLRLIDGEYALLHVGHQMAIRKRASLARYLSLDASATAAV